MATKAYEIWDAAGRHWEPARPISELEAWCEANGFTVLGTIGNDEHLWAATPEDHTPFSATAWPVPLPGYIVCAIDIADERELGAAILRDARAGLLPWLKYCNVGQKHYHCRDGFRSWTYNSDTHNHLSIRTDYIDASIGAFNPLGDSDMFEDEDRTLLRSIAGRTLAVAQGTERTAWSGMPFGQQEPIWVVTALKQLQAAAAADATRDAGVLAAVTALADAGGVDAAPIVAAIKAEGDRTRALVTEQHQEEMAALKREWDAEVAGLRAELAARPAAAA
jgi:hypothetical protein